VDGGVPADVRDAVQRQRHEEVDVHSYAMLSAQFSDKHNRCHSHKYARLKMSILTIQPHITLHNTNVHPPPPDNYIAIAAAPLLHGGESKFFQMHFTKTVMLPHSCAEGASAVQFEATKHYLSVCDTYDKFINSIYPARYIISMNSYFPERLAPRVRSVVDPVKCYPSPTRLARPLQVVVV